MQQQTAVEWLIEELHNEMGYGRDLTKSDRKVLDEIIQQAKQMEADQSKANCDIARMQGWSKGYEDGHMEGWGEGQFQVGNLS